MAIYGGPIQAINVTPDYGPSVAAARDLAMTQAQGVAGAVGQVADYFKQQGEKKKLIKKSDVQIDAALKLFPDLAPTLQGYRDQLKDENLPLDDRMAVAESISAIIERGVGEMRNAQDTLMKQQALGLEQQYKAAQLGMRAQEIGIQRQRAAAEAGELKESEISIFDPEINKTRSEKVWINKQGQAFDYDTKKPIINKEKYFYGEEGGLGELPPTSQVGSSLSESIANAAKMNIGALSTAKTPGTEGGNLGCADAICRTFEQATGEELVPGGTLSTREMATNLNKDPRFIKVPLTEAQKGDIVLTPRKGNKAGHTGIVLDGGAIASNSSKGFDGEKPGTFSLNYSISKWNQKITPRNPNETAAYRYVGSQQIDNALAVGDMSRQAIGTPEQQAMTAQQIEQGAGMATAQTNQGVPTEPSMTTQQPQLPQPQRRMVRGIPAGGGAKFRQFTPEEVAQYGSQGQVNIDTGEVRPIRPPSGMVIEQTPEGGFRVVQGAGVGGRQEQVQKAQQEQKISRSTMGTQEIGRALEVLDSGVMQGSGPLASFYRAGASKFIKGTPEYKLANEFIAPIKSMLAFDELNKMRAASPTGGALGNVAKFETDMLQQTAGQLDIDKADPKTIRENLMRLSEKYLDAVHGTIQDREKLLRDNKISKETFLEILSLYPAFTMGAKGEMTPRQVPQIEDAPEDNENARIEAILKQHGVISK